MNRNTLAWLGFIATALVMLPALVWIGLHATVPESASSGARLLWTIVWVAIAVGLAAFLVVTIRAARTGRM